MNNDIRWKQRFNNFDNAYATFCRVVKAYEADKTSEITKMALVQSYEFTFELAWKTLKDYLENEGYDEVKNAKQTIRQAFQAEILHNPEEWMDAIQKRNLTSHVYNKDILQEAVDFIYDRFYPIVSDLYHLLKKAL